MNALFARTQDSLMPAKHGPVLEEVVFCESLLLSFARRTRTNAGLPNDKVSEGGVLLQKILGCWASVRVT